MAQHQCKCGRPATIYDGTGNWICAQCAELLLNPDMDTSEIRREAIIPPKSDQEDDEDRIRDRPE